MRKFMRPAGSGRQTWLELADNMKFKCNLILIRFFLLCVVAFQSASSGAQTFTNLYSFTNVTNGIRPNGLTLGPDGNFYGTTYSGGFTNISWPSGLGTVFKVTTDGTLTTLCSFGSPYQTYGWNPSGKLTLGNDGNFYGTTYYGYNSSFAHPTGYPSGAGSVFKVTTNGILTTLVYFNGTNGAFPAAGVTLGNDGNFYGTTVSGSGNNSYGSIFKVTTNGTLTTLGSFKSGYLVGDEPRSKLTLDNEGNFYGTTEEGGVGGGYGTVFEIMSNGVLETLWSFDMNLLDYGNFPAGVLTLGYDGNIYGAASSGGKNNYGTLFKVMPNGMLTAFYSFSNGSDGSNPGFVTLGNDGNFYGTTAGTIFKYTTDGTLTTLVSFNGTNGISPTTLTLGNDGNYYGTTLGDGQNNDGTIFRLMLSPVIVNQPANQSILLGGNAVFAVTANGTPPLKYQWQFNGTNIVGATNATYTIPAVVATNTGNYSVTVTNSTGGVISSNALLTVIVPPVVSFQFLAGFPQLNLNGMLSSNFTVQYSTNLAGTNWINLRSVSNLSANPYQFLDPAGIVPPARFYRALMQ